MVLIRLFLSSALDFSFWSPAGAGAGAGAALTMGSFASVVVAAVVWCGAVRCEAVRGGALVPPVRRCRCGKGGVNGRMGLLGWQAGWLAGWLAG
ncbi:hypothetical protein BS50DRAFT_579513 [Corynespora cassiicola Philippines]|uniref:Uncharacterized protein n=1 Tax=Corynespora cassiicola Philippines TaxID=1448308 RepID=A0A2T2N4Q1_CORCC|nr:hypothetical protein BS50DRAFT_579513 [Corynespora cassiicola Philippines]